MDHSFFEPDRIAYLQGAEILIDPSADLNAGYNFWASMRGVWARVQENPAYGVLSSMVGNVLNFHFSGKSGVYGPLDLTPAGDGVWRDGALPPPKDAEPATFGARHDRPGDAGRQLHARHARTGRGLVRPVSSHVSRRNARAPPRVPRPPPRTREQAPYRPPRRSPRVRRPGRR